MATMNIKDPTVRELARRLAAYRHTSATGAIREALSEALEREEKARDGMAAQLLEIGRRAAAKTEPALTDEDLYDEYGAPR